MTSTTELVVDTSAAIAVLFDEPGANWLITTLVDADHCYMSAGTYLEFGIVLEAKFGPMGTGLAASFIRDAEIETVDVTPQITQRSLEGWRRFGKGRHPAGLNFGDCFTYGLASHHALPILCVGEDFRQTDIFTLVPPPP
jgi:ribonuclease VapC